MTALILTFWTSLSWCRRFTLYLRSCSTSSDNASNLSCTEYITCQWLSLHHSSHFHYFYSCTYCG